MPQAEIIKFILKRTLLHFLGAVFLGAVSAFVWDFFLPIGLVFITWKELVIDPHKSFIWWIKTIIDLIVWFAGSIGVYLWFT